jgi:hypothetical protein
MPAGCVNRCANFLPFFFFLVCAKLAGAPSNAQVELYTQNSYFVFQVIQVFLVTTITSAASSVVTKIISNPSSVLTLLGQSIPTASNFYISYFILQGLTIASGTILQIAGLILFKILGKILDSSPRKMYQRWSSLSGIGWGSVLPPFTNMAVIGMCFFKH